MFGCTFPINHAYRLACLQSGIRAPEVEEQLAKAGILVVADSCLKVQKALASSDAGTAAGHHSNM